ncbi:hypothetical protein BT63DRAFT_479968 [Microthyrium microscopicum]|uniref:Fermentation associated protein n=1 Tax=Microthyrium microscopicum TaxID=703497 RepID=A0A6A6U8R7_9PEZI|nr:hypothetical protein BT63DRAFT_479968 [Microthyrium microscopicum]
MVTGLVGQLIDGSNQAFNYILLIELILSGVLAVFFFAYFDRLIGTVLSYIIRFYTWRTYGAYVDIQAFQISLLGGRIFFKDVRYHGHNVTVLVHSGFITWHYWYPRARLAQIFQTRRLAKDKKPESPLSTSTDAAEKVDEETANVPGEKSTLPCRIKINVEGVQGFFYNRSPAYDNILENINRSLNQEIGSRRQSEDQQSAPGSNGADAPASKRHIPRPSFPAGWLKGNTSEDDEATSDSSKSSKPETPSWLRMFPIQVECKTAALILGNENTKSIITVKLDTASGTFDAAEAGPLDVYKIMFTFDFHHPYITLRPNMDFKEFQLTAAARMKHESVEQDINPKRKPSKRQRKIKVPFISSSGDSVRGSSLHSMDGATSPDFQNLPGEEQWAGLSRYLDDGFRNEHDEWGNVEYARSSVLADCPKIGFSFYWDIPGTVSKTLDRLENGKPKDHINGSLPPEYGMDILIYGGTVNYGPWTDRQRINFQNIFFPPIYAHAIPGTPLSSGDLRVSTEFKLYLSVEDETTLRLPVREQSKDWKWKGKAGTIVPRKDKNKKAPKARARGKRRQFWKASDKASAGPNARPYAWLDVKIPKNTTVNYKSDMIARPSGFKSQVDADIPSLEIYTSVNHGLLWRSGPTKLDCDLSVPLEFNTLREWYFNVENDDLDLFILRDHLFLITDVVGDWTAGPASEFHTFTPFRYFLDVHFRNFKMYLNSNDSNIINNPSELDDNHFLILHGRQLHAEVTIPLDELNPKRKEIPFNVVGRDFGLELCLNSRNTAAQFTGKRDIMVLEEVTLKGSHVANTDTSTQLTDRLTFNIHGSKVTLWMFGFVVHHLVTLKENYFGEHLHFKTLEEYQALASGKQVDAEETEIAQRSNRSNDLDIIMLINCDDIRVLLPTNIYKSTENVVIDVAYATADLRLSNYYLDMQMDSSPLSVSLDIAEQVKSTPLILDSRTEVFIQSVNVTGHRAFGLPPTEPTYFSHWDVSVGDITGEASIDFAEKLLHAAQSFALTIANAENSIGLIDLASIHDVTFVRAKTKIIKVWMHLDQNALLVTADPITVDVSDWASLDFSLRVKVLCPLLTVSLVDANSANRGRNSRGDLKPVTQAHLRTSLSLDVLQRKLNFSDERQKQQEYLMVQDSRTHRTTFLRNTEVMPQRQLLSKDDPPAMIFPPIPEPLQHHQGWPYQRSITPTFKSSSSRSFQFQANASPAQLGKLRRQKSTASLSQSIRSKRSHASFKTARAETPQSELIDLSFSEHRPGASRRTSRRSGVWSNNLVLSSPLATPYFPLNAVQPDASELPPLMGANSKKDLPGVDNDLGVPDTSLSEEHTHTSLIVSTGPGIQWFVKPDAIFSIMELLGVLAPKTPDDLLDELQVTVANKIASQEKLTHGTPEVLELRLDIPSIALRFLNPFEVDTPDMPMGLDQFDLSLTGLSFLGRHSTPGHDSDNTEAASLHCSFKSLTVKATERCPSHAKFDVALELRLDDLLFWLSFAEQQTINTSFRDAHIAVTSMQVGYLAAMVQRTTKLGQELANRVLTMTNKQSHRFASLAYILTLAGEDVSDPVFLTRPSYLLRASSGHLRNHDSWKIVSRLRHIYEHLPEDEQQRFKSNCLNTTNLMPANAEVVVINSWNQWRTWDLSDVQDSIAMKYLFGRKITPPIPAASSEKQLQVGIRSGILRAIIDLGRDQTDFAIRNLAVNLANSPASEPSGLNIVGPAAPSMKSILQIHAESISVNVNWAIFSVVESVLAVVRTTIQANNRKQSEAPSQPPRTPPKPKEGVYNAIQVVLTVNESALDVKTPNLQATFANNGMNMSIVGSSGPTPNDAEFVSAVLTSGEAWSEFRSSSRLLLKMVTQSPTLYISREAPEKKSLSQEVEWRLAGTSSYLFLNVESELLDMIEVVDHFITTEVAELVPRIKRLVGPPDERVKPKELLQRGLPKLNLALLMDSYSIRVALLQAITYTMEGKQGRISIVPRLLQEVSLYVNFDLDGNTHRLVTTTDGEEGAIASIRLPPVNGQLGIRHTPKRIVLNLRTIIEQIDIEASAVHAVLATFKRPEVSKTFRAIQSDISTIKDRVRAILPETTPPETPVQTEKPELVYNIGATLAGIKVTAVAPGKSRKDGLDTLSIGLDSVQLNAYNVTNENGPLLSLPEVQAQLRQVFVELHIQDSQGTRPCGKLGLSASIQATRRDSRQGMAKRNYKMEVNFIQLQLFAETASTVVDVLNHLQDRLKDVDLSAERRYLQRLRQPARRPSTHLGDSIYSEASLTSSGIFASAFSVSLKDIEVAWIIGSSVDSFPGHEAHDLVLSIKMIDLHSRSRSTSRLTIQDLQLQMVPISEDKQMRARNSALLPEVVFNVAYASSDEDRNMSFQSKSKSVDVQLESAFLLPANMIQRSILLAVDKFRDASALWEMTPTSSGAQRKKIFGDKRLSALLVDADFASALFTLTDSKHGKTNAFGKLSGRTEDAHPGRFGQFSSDGESAKATFRTPGIALKVEYEDDGTDSSFTAEFNISGSSNALTPMVVPLIMDISNSVKLIVEETDKPAEKQVDDPTEKQVVKSTEGKLSQSIFSDERLLNADPGALLGKTSFNLGIRICRQEFSLGCQPIARVDAEVAVDDIYITANSVKSPEQDLFFAVSASFEKLQASVQHVYSREPTFSFDMERLVLSVMNSKHLSGRAGISAVLKIFPMKTHFNARQLQDFLLFRDIWIPEEMRSSPAPSTQPTHDQQDYLVQRYQQVANATAFPWTATVSIQSIEVDLDMGQSIGKASLQISDLWASSKKNSDWEQNLCVGIEKVAIESTGRTSGFVELADVQVRTSISWPLDEKSPHNTPLIQASAGFNRLRVKAAFDYQAFGIIDIGEFSFVMYNIREGGDVPRDRLVAILDGGAIHACCTAQSAAQAYALFQAVEKLVQENQAAYSQSLKDIDRYLKRASGSFRPRQESTTTPNISPKPPQGEEKLDAPISLHTDVVVSLGAINLGVFPGSFSDSTVFLIDASNIQGRFAVKMDDGLIHSGLGMTLGKVQVALAQVPHSSSPKLTLEALTVEDVVHTLTTARGGIILRVPKVVARMQTWQAPRTYLIDYIFHSSFEGKVDVGWNFARITFIRDMYTTHSQSLASRLGKPLPESAVKITTTGNDGARPPSALSLSTTEDGEEKTEKITAVVNVPQSKYNYRALEAPVIETPQLADMGEATPPLEWIGLHRDRLPNVTHQIVIVGLLGVARNVEDAYDRILGGGDKS